MGEYLIKKYLNNEEYETLYDPLISNTVYEKNREDIPIGVFDKDGNEYYRVIDKQRIGFLPWMKKS